MGSRAERGAAGSRNGELNVRWFLRFLAGVRQFFVLAYNEPPGC